MKILLDIIEEHHENEEEIINLPNVGEIIEIIERDTSGFRGAIKKKIGRYQIKENIADSRMLLVEHTSYSYKECFTYSDLLYDQTIGWYYVTN